MKKVTLATIVVLLLSFLNSIFGQTNIREDFMDAEFFLSEEDYKEALYSYLKVYKAGYQENANINYRIGICYLNIPGQKEYSIKYLEKAITNISDKWDDGNFKDESAPTDAYLYLGNAYRINYRLDDAINAYKKYRETLNINHTENIEYTNQQIISCERAKSAILKPVSLLKENMGKKFNSKAINYHPVFSGDRSAMVFMSQLRFYDGVFYVKKINGSWSNSMNITPQIESDGDQYITSLSFDGKKLFLVKVGNFDGDVFVSEYSSGRWMPSKSIGKPINSKFFESHSSISPDGKTLYFTSNRKESIGQMDIFTSRLDDEGNWSEPKNLGPTVNTRLNEETPFIDVDGKTLFFSSQGHETIGGYDFFKTIKQGDGTWSKPEALPYPINTTDDDLFFFPSDKMNSGYLTLYDHVGVGSGDFYYIEILPESPAHIESGKISNQDSTIVFQEAPIDTIVKKPLIEPSFQQEPEETPSTRHVIKPILDSTIVFQDASIDTIVKKPLIEPSFQEEPKETPSTRHIIKPIFFEFDSYSLSEISKEKLDAIINVCKIYPEIQLEVRGHCDALGSDQYNLNLSEKRSNSVIKYLVDKGINHERLLPRGCSETENVAINTFPDGRDSEEGRKLNRRVEFKIMNNIGAIIVTDPVEVPENLKIK